MSRHWVPLLWTAAGLTFGNAIFTAIASLVYPGVRLPEWADQVNSSVFLLSALTAGLAGLGFWQSRRKN